MLPLVDLHCHLVAGADDGPVKLSDAVRMCEIAVQEGVGSILALAHQNEFYPDVTPETIQQGIAALRMELDSREVALNLVPGAEVMVVPDLIPRLQAGEFFTVGGHGKYLLIELPHGLFLDLRELVVELREAGIRPLLAHPEQVPEILFGEGIIEELIALGCVTVVSAGNVYPQPSAIIRKRIKTWFECQLVHCLGSDGHSPRRRPPHMRDAYRQISEWVGTAEADRICSLNGLAVLQGLPLQLPPPRRPRRGSWLPRLFGAGT